MSKNILVLIESTNPEDSSGVKGRLALINNLIKIGHHLKIYHLDLSVCNPSSIESITIKRNKLSLFYWLTKFKTFCSKWGFNFNKQVEGFLGFSFSHFEDVQRFKSILKKENPVDYDIILTLSKAASFRPHKAVLELPAWHSKWYAYIHDPYPMHSYPRPYDWVEPGHHHKRQFFVDVFKKATKLVYPSLYLAEWMESYYGKPVEKRLLIPHQLDQSLSVSKTNIYFNPKQFTILHAGSLMSARKPHGLVEAFKVLLDHYPELKGKAKLLFVGKKSCFHPYFIEVQKELPELEFTENSIPFNEVLRLQNDASVNVILEAKGSFSPFLPGKFPHCIMAQKPILLLGPYYSETRRILGKEHPYWSEVDDVNLIFKHLENLYSNYKSINLNEEYKREIAYLGSEYLKEII